MMDDTTTAPTTPAEWNDQVYEMFASASEPDTDEPTPGAEGDSSEASANVTPDADPEPETETPEADAEASDADAAGADDTPDDAAEATDTKKVVDLPFTIEGVAPEQAADVKITAKIDGKEKTLALPDIVRLAQSEPAAQRAKRELEVRLQERERDYGAREQELIDRVSQADEFALRLLTDDDYLLKTREQYAQHLTPEAQAQRARAEADALRREREEERRAQEFHTQAAEFFQNVAVPTLSEFQEKYAEVSEEEVLGRFNALTADLMVNGVIPPKHYAKVEAILTGELRDWVAERHEQRLARIRTKDAEALAAKKKAQAAQNASVAGAKPVGRSAAPAKAAKAPAPPKNVDEARRLLMSSFA